MKIQEIEFNRRKEMSEYLTATHMFCLLTMMFALALSKKMFLLENYNSGLIRFLIFFGAGLIGFALIAIYFHKNISLEAAASFTWTDFLYISFPLVIAAITLFTAGKNFNQADSVLLLPIIITSSILGKKPGFIVALLSIALIYMEKSTRGTPAELLSIIGENLILISVMLIVAWFVGAHADLDTRYRQRLTKLASTDLLTGLYNYGYFQEKIDEYVQKASATHPLGLIILDIDYFKHYNEIHGHQTGDFLISAIGDILNTKVSSSGFVSRYGGDEFVIVLPDTDSTNAKQLAEDISMTVSRRKFHGGEYQPEGKITISCGIAICPTHAHNARDLIKHADQALYRAKSLDKNKVEMYFSVFDSLDVEANEEELLNSIRTLVSVINAKDRYTYGHSERVTEHAIRLATRFGLPQEKIHLLGYAAFLHDIGKIEIDREVLNKVDRLSNKEWKMIQDHSVWGSEIVKAVPKLHPIVPVIRHHHENFDGSGYPAGLKGNEIPILARIIRIADSYDAMVSHRPYKKPLSVTEALEKIKSNSGTQFDPELAVAFMKIIQEDIKNRDSWLYQK
ncbi:MAG TPA: diguanylate cyclase [Syntrophomonas sp.]|jgi:diguanylate cyclase (GGDEF)-like protein|nr:diguanylate cyclase [Syntrophomonas sp.]